VTFKQERVSRVGAQALLSFEQSLLQYLETNAALDQNDRALLLRWVDDGRANEVWETIRAYSEQHKGAMAPDASISLVQIILSVKKMAVLEDEIIREKDIERWRSWLVKTTKTVPIELLFPFLELVVERHRPIHTFVTSPRRVRSDKKGSRARTLFIRTVSAAVRDLTGRWLDKQVAVIAQIAFDVEDIDIETVRSARRE
jgi:hypothetical protein